MKEEFIMPIWTEDQYICISVLPSDETGPRKNLTVGKIYIGQVEDDLDDYLYVVENDRGNDHEVGRIEDTCFINCTNLKIALDFLNTDRLC